MTIDDLSRVENAASRLVDWHGVGFGGGAAADDALPLRSATDSGDEGLVGISPALRAAIERAQKVAPVDSTVLITGETGTGKELIARGIHKWSRRASRPFVSVNCAAIPQSLIASELFGHERGAFTGALQRRPGRFELAAGGTVFLDEVGELPLETQVALLRVLQEHEFERVGGSTTIRTDVRIVAATNRDLEEAIAAGIFRSDLYYRLNVFPIEMPALRQRTTDVRPLLEHFVSVSARRTGKTIRRISRHTLELLEAYPWPGNVRELQNVVERSVIVCDSDTFAVDESWLRRHELITSGSVHRGLDAPVAPRGAAVVTPPSGAGTLMEIQRDAILRALDSTNGVVGGPRGAAALLGVKRTTLQARMRKLGIGSIRLGASESDAPAMAVAR